MGKINEDYANLTGVASGDLLPIVDVSDLSMSASGTTKHTAVSSLASAVTQFPAGGTPPLTSTGFYISEFANIAAWTEDPSLIGGSSVVTSGQLYVRRVRAVQPTAAKLACYIGTPPGTLNVPGRISLAWPPVQVTEAGLPGRWSASLPIRQRTGARPAPSRTC